MSSVSGCPPAPEPSIDIEVVIESLPKGSTLWRCHKGANGVALREQDGISAGRFHPLPPPFEKVPTIYFGEREEAAFAETMLRWREATPEDARDIQYDVVMRHALTQVETTRVLTFVRLVDVGLARLMKSKVHNPDQIVTCDRGDYPTTRAWAQRLRKSGDGAEGLMWMSKHHGSQKSYVFFGDGVKEGDFHTVQTRRLSDLGNGAYQKFESMAKLMGWTILDVKSGL